MVERPHILLRGLLLALTFALTLAGIGHPPPTSDDLARAEFEQTFGDVICQADGDQAGAQNAPCPLCRIVAAYVLPEPAFVVERTAFAPYDADWPDAAPPASRSGLTERPPQRGPPLA